MKADSLAPGDQFVRRMWNDGELRETRLTILREREPAPHPFDLPWFRLWVRREDTGEEGYVSFRLGDNVPTPEVVGR